MSEVQAVCGLNVTGVKRRAQHLVSGSSRGVSPSGEVGGRGHNTSCSITRTMGGLTYGSYGAGIALVVIGLCTHE